MLKLKREETQHHVVFTADHSRWSFDKRDHSKLQDVLELLYEYQCTGLEPQEVKEALLNLHTVRKKYEPAEKDGRLILLPCKAGDTVYYNAPSFRQRHNRAMLCIVDEFELYNGRVLAVLNATDHGFTRRRFCAVLDDDFGKTVFLSREEADAAWKGGASE